MISLLAGPLLASVFVFFANVQPNKGTSVMKISRTQVVNHQGLNGIWLPPRRWKIRLYKLFGLTAPDRWVRFKD